MKPPSPGVEPDSRKNASLDLFAYPVHGVLNPLGQFLYGQQSIVISTHTSALPLALALPVPSF